MFQHSKKFAELWNVSQILIFFPKICIFQQHAKSKTKFFWIYLETNVLTDQFLLPDTAMMYIFNLEDIFLYQEIKIHIFQRKGIPKNFARSAFFTYYLKKLTPSPNPIILIHWHTVVTWGIYWSQWCSPSSWFSPEWWPFPFSCSMLTTNNFSK